jgi:hypothetical protein
MVRQGQIVRNPNDGNVEHQVAARHYFGADDRLMAVQRYSWRGPSFRDGTWEDRYDALGRRIATRVRRDQTPFMTHRSRALSARARRPPSAART